MLHHLKSWLVDSEAVSQGERHHHLTHCCAASPEQTGQDKSWNSRGLNEKYFIAKSMTEMLTENRDIARLAPGKNHPFAVFAAD